MDKKQHIYNIFAIFVLCGVALLFTTFSTPIRKTIQTSQKIVAGASTERIDLQAKLPQELSKDAVAHVDTVKKSAMEIKVGEIIEVIGRGGKIIQDVRSIPENIDSAIKSITKK